MWHDVAIQTLLELLFTKKLHKRFGPKPTSILRPLAGQCENPISPSPPPIRPIRPDLDPEEVQSNLRRAVVFSCLSMSNSAKSNMFVGSKK